MDLGEFNDKGRDSLYQLGEQYARRAVQADPSSTMTHFALARALGRRALSLGVRERVKYAGEVRKEALESLKIDSTNPGSLHIMGMWHANVMRLNGIARFLAKNLLGGRVFDEANWKDAAPMYSEPCGSSNRCFREWSSHSNCYPTSHCAAGD